MGFRICLGSTWALVLADIILIALRPTFRLDSDVDQFVMLAVHVCVVILEAVVIFSFFSNTVWFTAGLFGELLATIKLTFPLYFCHLLLTAFPIIYRRFIRGLKSTAMEDGASVAMFIADYIVAVSFWVSLMYTACCMTDIRMYAPYHKMPVEAIDSQQPASIERPSAPISSSGGSKKSATRYATAGAALGLSSGAPVDVTAADAHDLTGLAINQHLSQATWHGEAAGGDSNSSGRSSDRSNSERA